MKKLYNKRVWLNSDKSASTGSVVCFHGKNPWNKKLIDMFLEVSSCHDIARLHKTKYESIKDFIKKLKLLRDEIDRFIKFLEKC